MKIECRNCLFAFEESVPDPLEAYVPGKKKKRITCLCCHVTKPAHNGFPVVRAESFCGLFTNKETRNQPLAPFTKNVVIVKENLPLPNSSVR